MLGKRERPNCESEAVAKLASVFEKIKEKYTNALVAIRQDVKTDPLSELNSWCGQVIRLCVNEFPRLAQKHLLDAIRDVVDTEKSTMQPQDFTSGFKPVKIDLVDSLVEIVQQFQLKVLTYENDLQTKVTESGKLILELEAHSMNNQA
jgi:hypothetical protein